MSRGRAISAAIAAFQARSDDSWDCLPFALTVTVAAGNRDLRSLVPNYTTRLGAIRALRCLGYETLEEALDANATRIASGFALPGDICVIDVEPIGMAGIVIGRDAVFLQAGGGHLRRPVAGLPCWRPV